MNLNKLITKTNNITFFNAIYVFNLIPRGIFTIFSRTGDISSISLYKRDMSLILFFLWGHLGTQTKMFSDLLASDYPNYICRFLAIYNVTSLVYNFRYILKVWVEQKSILNTVTNLYTCASWFEREIWDMYGLFFINNMDLRRILNDYGFIGHPMKKDFPLSGFLETTFCYISGVMRYVDIKMVQEFRFFNINAPWKYYINNK